VRFSETDVDLADIDLAAEMEVYNEPASALRTMAHNHPASQDVGLTPIQETSGKRLVESRIAPPSWTRIFRIADTTFCEPPFPAVSILEDGCGRRLGAA
jgi:hypothetical protein